MAGRAEGGPEVAAERVERAPGWFFEARSRLGELLLRADGRSYPCHFGVDGERRGWNAYTWVDRGMLAGNLDRLAAELRKSLAESARRPRLRRSLICFVGPPEAGSGESRFAGYEAEFWGLLAQLHARDPHPWPAGMPIDVEDPRWEFCFAGEPIFVFGMCPAYRRRRSRNVGGCLTLVFQSKTVFWGTGGETAAGRAAKARIRSMLLRYDLVGPHAALGDHRHSSLFKWRQYFLPDDESEAKAGCPLRLGG